jgi:hypothetical protein
MEMTYDKEKWLSAKAQEYKPTATQEDYLASN